MYTPPAFAVEDTTELYEMMRQCRLANFVTATPDGPIATPYLCSSMRRREKGASSMRIWRDRTRSGGLLSSDMDLQSLWDRTLM